MYPSDISNVSLFSGIYFSCIPAFPFDLPTQSGTFSICNMGTSGLPEFNSIASNVLLSKCFSGHVKMLAKIMSKCKTTLYATKLHT